MNKILLIVSCQGVLKPIGKAMKRRWMTRPFNSAPSTHANSFKRKSAFNPFASKSDQFQISPAASPEILHQTEGRTWLFIAYSDERRISSQFSLQHLYISLLKRLGECTFSRTSLSMIVVTIRETPLSQNKKKLRSCTLSFPTVINFKIPLQSHQKYYITQYGELGFS